MQKRGPALDADEAPEPNHLAVVIPEFVEERDADLLVFGTKSRKG